MILEQQKQNSFSYFFRTYLFPNLPYNKWSNAQKYIPEYNNACQLLSTATYSPTIQPKIHFSGQPSKEYLLTDLVDFMEQVVQMWVDRGRFENTTTAMFQSLNNARTQLNMESNSNQTNVQSIASLTDIRTNALETAVDTGFILQKMGQKITTIQKTPKGYRHLTNNVLSSLNLTNDLMKQLVTARFLSTASLDTHTATALFCTDKDYKVLQSLSNKNLHGSGFQQVFQAQTSSTRNIYNPTSKHQREELVFHFIQENDIKKPFVTLSDVEGLPHAWAKHIRGGKGDTFIIENDQTTYDALMSAAEDIGLLEDPTFHIKFDKQGVEHFIQTQNIAFGLIDLDYRNHIKHNQEAIITMLNRQIAIRSTKTCLRMSTLLHIKGEQSKNGIWASQSTLQEIHLVAQSQYVVSDRRTKQIRTKGFNPYIYDMYCLRRRTTEEG